MADSIASTRLRMPFVERLAYFLVQHAHALSNKELVPRLAVVICASCHGKSVCLPAKTAVCVDTTMGGRKNNESHQSCSGTIQNSSNICVILSGMHLVSNKNAPERSATTTSSSLQNSSSLCCQTGYR